MDMTKGYTINAGTPKPLAQEDLEHIRRRSASGSYGKSEPQAQWDLEALLQHIDAQKMELDELNGVEERGVNWMGDEQDDAR
jgi:hypothetical protein